MSLSKMALEHITLICSHIVYDRVHTTTKLSGFKRDHPYNPQSPNI